MVMNIISTKTATFKPSEVVGMRVVLTTNPTTSHSASHTQSPKNVNTTSHNYDGTVILFSPLDDLICLSPTSFPTDLILLQVSKILDCQVVHARGQDHHLIKIMAEIDSAAQHQDLQKLIKANIEKEKQRDKLLGVGVDPQEQAIFDGLKKTLPCTWKGTTITLLDCTIQPPYTQVHGSDVQTKNRIMKVLGNIRLKLGLADA